MKFEVTSMYYVYLCNKKEKVMLKLWSTKSYKIAKRMVTELKNIFWGYGIREENKFKIFRTEPMVEKAGKWRFNNVPELDDVAIRWFDVTEEDNIYAHDDHVCEEDLAYFID